MKRFPNRTVTITLRVNGSTHEVEVAPTQMLLSVLRDHLDLTGTKYGCGEGQCGACTVLIDGQPVTACQARVSTLPGKSIANIASLEQNGRLHAVQEAFLKHEALQCGYCTPGMIMSAVALVAANRNPTDEAIAKAMDKHLCRCGAYPRIVAAIKDASGHPSARVYARARGDERV
jgi:aerobic-type carbon monoxide dehydrogenase small subunit (CoxS/CutS family)